MQSVRKNSLLSNDNVLNEWFKLSAKKSDSIDLITSFIPICWPSNLAVRLSYSV